MGDARNKLKNLRKTKWPRRRRKVSAKKRATFISNSFGFPRSLLGDKMSGNLETSGEKIKDYLRNSFCDLAKDQGLNGLLIRQNKEA